MARKLTIPSLADISQDIAGNIPLNLIQSWVDKNKTAKLHKQILKLFQVTGTVVSTDSAGLSKLSKERSLIEVMKLVSFPKEIIFKHGLAIGGKAIGIWAADNTQMFYPNHVSCQKVVEAMKLVQNELKNNELQIGMAIHHGNFFEIAGGLFGEDADLVENLAENESRAGEIILTKALKTKLQEKNNQAKLDEKIVNNLHYPYPFTEEFYFDIKNNIPKVEEKYLTKKTVILIKILHPKKKFLLDELTDWIIANSIVTKTALNFSVKKIKSNGSLGIFVCDNSKEGIDFAKEVKDNLTRSGYVINIGIAKGDVLLFDLKENGFEIAGEPVNIASKIAEDTKERNCILVEKSVRINNNLLKDKFSYEISHINIKGVKI